MTKEHIRYLYVKYGDVTQQIETIDSMQNRVPNGPDSFVADFLGTINNAPVLFLSMYKASHKRIKIGNVEAQCFPVNFDGMGPLGAVVGRIYFIVASLFKILRYKPDRIICVRRGALLWMSCAIGKLYNSPFIYVSHDMIEVVTKNRIKKFFAALDEWCIRHATSCVCHGPFTRDQVKAIGVQGSKIIEFDGDYRYIFETAAASTGESPLPQSAEGRTILYVGRMEEHKGVFDLLEACAQRLKLNTALRLVFAGAGNVLPKLRECSEAHGLEKQVFVLGKVPYQQIPALMKQARVLVTPTRTSFFHEGHRHATIEGIVLGLPVVAPDFGPYPYLVKNNDNGLLYEPDSVEDLEAKLFLIVDDDDFHRRLSEGARRLGDKLIDPPIRFGQAIQQAFS